MVKLEKAYALHGEKERMKVPNWFGKGEIFLMDFGCLCMMLMIMIVVIVAGKNLIDLFIQPFMLFPYIIIGLAVYLSLVIWNQNLRKRKNEV